MWGGGGDSCVGAPECDAHDTPSAKEEGGGGERGSGVQGGVGVTFGMRAPEWMQLTCKAAPRLPAVDVQAVVHPGALRPAHQSELRVQPLLKPVGLPRTTTEHVGRCGVGRSNPMRSRQMATGPKVVLAGEAAPAH